MSTHSLHHMIRDAGLSDGCLRCAEIAERPESSLDDGNLKALIERTQAWTQDLFGSEPRSRAEAKAMRAIEAHLVFVRNAKRTGVGL